MAATTVTLGSITFNAVDGDGATWRCKQVEGWHGFRSRIARFDRPAAAGDVLADIQHRGRLYTLKDCYLRATSHTQLWTKLGELSDAVDLVSSSGTLTVNEPTPKQATVRVEEFRSPQHLSDKLVRFELELYAPDPRKYATSTTAISGAGAYTNAGNFPTQRIDLTLSAGSTLTNTTDSSKAIVTTGAGSLAIAVDTRTVTKSSVNAYDQIDATTAWPSLLPGSNTLTLDTGTVTGTFRSAWI